MKKHKHNFLGLGLRVLYLLNHIINIYSVYYNIVVVRKNSPVFRRSDESEYELDMQPYCGIAGQSADHEVKVHRQSTVSRRPESTVEHL